MALSTKEKVALFASGIALTMGACAQPSDSDAQARNAALSTENAVLRQSLTNPTEAAEIATTVAKTLQAPLPTLRPTETPTATLYSPEDVETVVAGTVEAGRAKLSIPTNTPSPTSQFDIPATYAALETEMASDTATPTARATSTPEPTNTLPPTETPPAVATVAVQSQVVHGREGNRNDVMAPISVIDYTTIDQWWNRELNLFEQVGTGENYNGDSFITSITNDPRMDSEGNPIYTDNSVNADPQEEFGLGHEKSELRQYKNILQVLQENPMVIDLYWNSKDRKSIHFGFYGMMHDRDAVLAVEAAIEFFARHPEIDSNIRINDLLSQHASEIRKIQLELLARIQKETLGTSSEEIERRTDPDSKDASKLLGVIAPELVLPNEFDACDVVRPGEAVREDQLQVNRETTFKDDAPEFGEVRRPTTNRAIITGGSFLKADPNNFGIKAFDGGAAKRLYPEHYDANGNPTPEATFIPAELSALNEQMIACGLRLQIEITPSATFFITPEGVQVYPTPTLHNPDVTPNVTPTTPPESSPTPNLGTDVPNNPPGHPTPTGMPNDATPVMQPTVRPTETIRTPVPANPSPVAPTVEPGF